MSIHCMQGIKPMSWASRSNTMNLLQDLPPFQFKGVYFDDCIDNFKGKNLLSKEIYGCSHLYDYFISGAIV